MLFVRRVVALIIVEELEAVGCHVGDIPFHGDAVGDMTAVGGAVGHVPEIEVPLVAADAVIELGVFFITAAVVAVIKGTQVVGREDPEVVGLAAQRHDGAIITDLGYLPGRVPQHLLPVADGLTLALRRA